MQESTAVQGERSEEVRRGALTWLISGIVGIVVTGALLLFAAGKLNWWWAWAVMAEYAGWHLVSAAVLMPRNPELLAERASRKEDIKSWDVRLMSIVGIAELAKFIVAGLDMRFGWSPSVAFPLQLLALLLGALGYALLTWAMVVNAYFSKMVRIQKDRGQTVATDGPYQVMRHPGYVGTILFELASPIALGSWWALIPGALAAALLVLRTALEDRTLQEELPGYKDYAQRVRHRLIPGLW